MSARKAAASNSARLPSSSWGASSIARKFGADPDVMGPEGRLGCRSRAGGRKEAVWQRLAKPLRYRSSQVDPLPATPDQASGPPLLGRLLRPLTSPGDDPECAA